MSKLTNKVALVTGGSRGIGAAIAKRLAADGASVAITYAKDASAASAVVKAIELAGGKAVAIQADAADAEAVKGAVEKAVATFGRLDVLVNNAGTAIPKPFEETTLEEMDRVIDINVRGVLATTQAALKHMKEGRPHHHDRLGRGRACRCAGACALLGHEGRRQDVHPGVVQRGREPGHHGQQCAAGADRHGFESRRGGLGGAAEGRHGARSLRACGRDRRDGGVRRRSGVLVHHRGESYRGWRNECLNRCPHLVSGPEERDLRVEMIESRRPNGVGSPSLCQM